MAWWNRTKEKKEAAVALAEKRSVPSGLWQKCDECGAILESQALAATLRVCPKCSFHFILPTTERISLITDEGTFVEEGQGLASEDPLGFRDSKRYIDRLKAATKNAGTADAFRFGLCRINGEP